MVVCFYLWFCLLPFLIRRLFLILFTRQNDERKEEFKYKELRRIHEEDCVDLRIDTFHRDMIHICTLIIIIILEMNTLSGNLTFCSHRYSQDGIVFEPTHEEAAIELASDFGSVGEYIEDGCPGHV